MSSLDRIPTLTDDDIKVIRLIEHQSDDLTRKCFEAALIHLEYAHKIVAIDPAMAIFRSITAEEESATAVFRLLQKLGYPRANEINPKSHLHKAAAYPFILGVVKYATHLKIDGIDEIRLGVAENDMRSRLVIGLILNGWLKGNVAQPCPPLNLTLSQGGERQPPDYRRYLVDLLDADRVADIRKYFERKANRRNILLYAGPKGLINPRLDVDLYLKQQKNCVVTLIKTALLIWPYSEIQLFVTSLIEAFLLAVQKVQREDSELRPNSSCMGSFTRP